MYINAGGGGDLNFIAADHTTSCPCNLSDGIIADGKEEMISAVRKEIKFGSDWIKLLVTGTECVVVIWTANIQIIYVCKPTCLSVPEKEPSCLPALGPRTVPRTRTSLMMSSPPVCKRHAAVRYLPYPFPAFSLFQSAAYLSLLIID